MLIIFVSLCIAQHINASINHFSINYNNQIRSRLLNASHHNLNHNQKVRFYQNSLQNTDYKIR